MKTNPVIGIDVGGTKILAAVVDEHGRILGRSKRKTIPRKARESGPDLVVERMAKTVQEAIQKANISPSEIAAVGASAPGPVDITIGRVFGAVNIPGWGRAYDLGPALSRLLDMPVVVDNDVNLGTLGEATFGAARGIDDVLGVFVGTGIGGGVILDGKVRRGFRWGAGEIGHMLMSCEGKHADVEALASRGAISRRLRQAVEAGESPLLADILRRRGDDRITSGVIRQALEAGDLTTRQIVASAQDVLGLHIASMVNLLDPQCIVLGGGLVESLGEAFIGPVRETAYANFFLQQDAHQVQIVQAALGDDAVVLGAAVLAGGQ
ncbi:MAG TPA: ROK family protein [Caldilineae bacterium]|nr:ROK family protein [Caldilineae bacterium]